MQNAASLCSSSTRKSPANLRNPKTSAIKIKVIDHPPLTSAAPPSKSAITKSLHDPSTLKPPRSTKTKRARTMAGLINSNPWSPELETSLSTLIPLSQTTVLHTLRLIKDPPKASNFFNWAYRSGFTHTSQSYLLMLQILCHGRNFNEATNLLYSIPEMSNGAVILEDKHFNALIQAFGEAGLFSESLKVFKTMKSMGISPSTITFNHLFSILLKRGRTGVACQLFDEMLKTYGVKPDLFSFNILIRGFCKNSMVDVGFKFFREMEKFRCKPDVVTYNTIVDGLCRIGKVNTARNVLEGMLKKGSDLSPNVVTYTTLIRGYCEKQDIENALRVFEDMVDQGLKPNEITYNTLIQGLCTSQRSDKTIENLEGFCRGNGEFSPDTCTFNTLINVHCSEGKLEEGMNIFNKMLEFKVHPDSATYSMLIRSFCEKGEFEKAEELVDELMQKDVLLSDKGCTPIVASYNPIFKYLCENHKTEKADKLFRALMQRGTQDAPAFKTLILGHCKELTAKSGHELLVAMLRHKFVPDTETYEALIVGLLKTNNHILAQDALQKMLFTSPLPETSLFHNILSGLVKNGCVLESASLLMLMLREKVRPNIRLSTDVVKLLLKGGFLNEGLEVVRVLYESGYVIDMEDLIPSLCQHGKLLEAYEFLVFCVKNGQKIRPDICSCLVVELCKIGKVSEGFGIYYELLEHGVELPFNCLEDLRVGLEANGKSKEAEFVSKRMQRNRHEDLTVGLEANGVFVSERTQKNLLPFNNLEDLGVGTEANGKSKEAEFSKSFVKDLLEIVTF